MRSAILYALGTPAITFVGIRPRDDPWTEILRLLPVEVIEVSSATPCYSPAELNVTISWLSCDSWFRRGDCRVSALDELCDLAACEAILARLEAGPRGGRPFETVTRLRPDVFIEARVRLPLPPRAATVYVPEADQQGGENDHLAFGGRQAMRLYLTRVRPLLRAGLRSRKGRHRIHNTEQLLALALQADELAVARLPGWIYCLHTFRGIVGWGRSSGRVPNDGGNGVKGCIGRVRCRAPCASMLCAQSGMQSGPCECFNVSCATIGSGAVVARGKHYRALGPFGGRHGPFRPATIPVVAPRPAPLPPPHDPPPAPPPPSARPAGRPPPRANPPALAAPHSAAGRLAPPTPP